MLPGPSISVPYLDLIYLLYGASFILLGIAVLAQPRVGSAIPLVRSFGLLAAFGLLHGINEWFFLWRSLQDDSPSLTILQLLLLFSSYLALFEFGRCLLCRLRGQGRGWLSPWVYAPLLGLFLLGMISADDPATRAEVLIRYLLGFPAGLLAAWAFHATYSDHRLTLPARPLGVAFRGAALGFILYAVLGGLVVPPSPLVPAHQFNSGAFLAVTGVPVQAGRTLAALLIAGAIVPILRFFHQQTREGIQESNRLRHRHSRILEATGEGVLELSPLGRVNYANPAALRMLGYDTLEGILNAPIMQFLAAPSGDHPLVAAYQVGRGARFEQTRMRHRDGRTFPVQFSTGPLFDEGLMTGAVITFQDSTPKREAERQKLMAKVVYDHVPEGILVTDVQGRIESANPAFCRAIGYPEAELLGQHPVLFEAAWDPKGLYRTWPAAVDPEHGWQGEVWSRGRGGSLEAAWVTVSPVHGDHGLSHFIAIYTDLASQEEAYRRLHRLAYYDGLTGLPNRELFLDRLQQAQIHARRREQQGAVLFLDLDIFKGLNDTHGHATGDRLLEAIGQRLPGALREGDTMARFAGDEFTVLLPSPVDQSGAEQVAEKLRAAMATPFEVDGLSLETSASIGLALFPDQGNDAEAVIAAADAAMYTAKTAGGNRWEWADTAVTCPVTSGS